MNDLMSCILLFLSKRFGKTTTTRFCRIYANADWHSYRGETEIKSRLVRLHSQVREVTTYSLFGRELDLVTDDWISGSKSKQLTEGTCPSKDEVARVAAEFLEAANPENLPMTGETTEEMFADLVKETVAFLTRASNSFQWSGSATFAKGNVSTVRLQLS